LAAIRMIGKAYSDLDTNIELSSLYKEGTIQSISSEKQSKFLKPIPINKVESDQYPLSFVQEQLYFVEQMESFKGLYNIPLLFKLSKQCDLERLEQAINLVVQRNPILQMVYLQNNEGELYQEIVNQKINIKFDRVSNFEDLKRIISLEVRYKFDLSNEISLRINCFLLNTARYILINWHHISFDGWSQELFIRELANAYEHAYNDIELAHEPIKPHYGDYTCWERENLDLTRLQTYWKEILNGYEPLLLPTDFKRPTNIDYQGNSYYFEFDEDLTQNLREFAQLHHTTLYTVVISAYFILLSKLSGQKDIVVGTPADNRQQPQVQSVMGLFVNLLPLRLIVNDTETIVELVTRMSNIIIDSKLHEAFPFEKMVSTVESNRDLSKHPIFQTLFSFQDYQYILDSDSGLPLDFLEHELGESLPHPARYDLSVIFSESNKELNGHIIYATSLFEEASIALFVMRLKRVLVHLVKNPSLPVQEINVTNKSELAQIDRFSKKGNCAQ
ncbi:condensation domain-containing protein, partial [Psychrobacter aquimaris]|uniref:condensation domain-containing protein n=1 Tax=Psychrobacter aquimaris TaxID=292733 RepID=UPI003FD5D3CB